MLLTGHPDTASTAKDLRFGDNTIAADVNTTRKNFKVEIDRFVLSVIPRPVKVTKPPSSLRKRSVVSFRLVVRSRRLRARPFCGQNGTQIGSP